jgi:hypothetical protein
LTKLQKPYYKLYKKIGKLTAWLVDGEFIRNNIDIEFTNYAQRQGWNNYVETRSFDYIPENELWIDKYRIPGEEKFYIDSMVLMRDLLNKKIKHKEAIKIADIKEINARKKSSKGKKHFSLTKSKAINIIHKNIIKKYSNNIIKVWLVNGRLVRDIYFTDFAQGGNDKIYKFIPKNEIWIDDNLNPKEHKYVILHELYERNLMALGESYDIAHPKASKLELKFRKDSKGLVERIKKEIHKHIKLR